MHFHRLELKDIPLVQGCFDGLLSNTCDYSIGGIFMWRDYFQMEYAILDGTFFSRLTGLDGKVYYNLPLGNGDKTASVRYLIDCLHQEGQPARFCTIPEAYMGLFSNLGIRFHQMEQPEYADYLYAAEDLAHFNGEKYRSQRNHVHQFLRFASAWSYDSITEDNLSDIIVFFRDFYPSELDTSSSAVEESKKVLEVLNNLDKYQMRGGVLSVNGIVVGFSLCETIGDTMYVHIEKGDREVPGAYPMLVQQSAAQYAAEGIKFINREDDMGDKGLQKSKLAYQPIRLLKKYILEEERDEVRR